MKHVYNFRTRPKIDVRYITDGELDWLKYYAMKNVKACFTNLYDLEDKKMARELLEEWFPEYLV